MRNLQFPTNLVSELGVPQIQDITDKLPHNPNYTWEQLAGRRDINDLTTIILHHSGCPKAWGLTAERHAINHINGRAYEPKGEPTIPYHVYLNNGQAYQVNDILDRVYGVASNNAYTVHICVEGDYTKDVLTPADRNALIATIITVKSQLPAFKEIKGHSELNATDCPGYDFKGIINDVKSVEMKLMQAESWNAKMAKVSEFVNEVNYLTSLIKAGENDGNAVWGMSVLSEAIDIFKEKKLL